ncbi:hypothetical protein VU07_02360 [Desulfobulbus sp. F4]|nr:hypothetical protein [Desulfobulbus sp. F4]
MKAGVFRRVVGGVGRRHLQERGGLDIREAFTDSGFIAAEKGGLPPAGKTYWRQGRAA